MIKKELEIIQETERQCRELQARADLERQEILRDAKTEARQRRDALVQAAHEEGARHLREAAAREAAARAERIAQWEADVALVREKSLGRMRDAVHTIFEGMWDSGDCSDDQFQPDGA